MAGALAIGRVVGAHGVRGALRVRLYDPDSTSLAPRLRVFLRAPSGSELDHREHEVVSVSPKPGSAVVRVSLAEVSSREVAEQLRGCELWVERDELGVLQDDEFYLADMIGCRVERRLPDGDDDGELQQLGEVIGVTSNGVQDLFEVRYATSPGGRPRTWLLPVLPQFLLETSAERILVELPEGLLPSKLETP